VSDFTAFFYVSRVVEFGVTQQIFTNPAHKQTEEYSTGGGGAGRPAPSPATVSRLCPDLTGSLLPEMGWDIFGVRS
jgi:hypothetical protein